jgi:hypothetical protein
VGSCRPARRSTGGTALRTRRRLDLRRRDVRDLDPGRRRDAIEPTRWHAAVKEVIGKDAAEEDIRPDEVTNTPKLVDMRDLDEGKIACTFAVAKRVAKVIHNFALEDVYADEFFVAIVRLNDGIVEVRGSHERAKRLRNTWLGEVDARLGA